MQGEWFCCVWGPGFNWAVRPVQMCPAACAQCSSWLHILVGVYQECPMLPVIKLSPFYRVHYLDHLSKVWWCSQYNGSKNQCKESGSVVSEVQGSIELRDQLTHWGRVTHICVSKVTITGSDNGLSPGRRQAIIWSNAGILLIRPLGTNFSEILIGVQTFSLRKMELKMSSAK